MGSSVYNIFSNILLKGSIEIFRITMKRMRTSLTRVRCPVARTFCVPICHNLLMDQTDLVETIEGSENLNFDDKYWCANILAQYALVSAYSEAS